MWKPAVLIAFSLGLAGIAAEAGAHSLLTCRDSSGKALFKGYIEEGKEEAAGKFSRERTVTYTATVASKPKLVSDRQSLHRQSGLDFPKCKGPYGYVYERVTRAGSLRCAVGEVSVLENFEPSDRAIIKAFGRNEDELDCSVIIGGER